MNFIKLDVLCIATAAATVCSKRWVGVADGVARKDFDTVKYASRLRRLFNVKEVEVETKIIITSRIYAAHSPCLNGIFLVGIGIGAKVVGDEGQLLNMRIVVVDIQPILS